MFEDTVSLSVEFRLCKARVHEMKSCPIAERQKIDAGSRDVFAQLPRPNADTVLSVEVRLIEQLRLDQMYLA